MAINIGSRVKLRSGGPLMTVRHLRGNDVFGCVWFDKTDTLHEGDFELAILMVVGDEDR